MRCSGGTPARAVRTRWQRGFCYWVVCVGAATALAFDPVVRAEARTLIGQLAEDARAYLCGGRRP